MRSDACAVLLLSVSKSWVFCKTRISNRSPLCWKKVCYGPLWCEWSNAKSWFFRFNRIFVSTPIHSHQQSIDCHQRQKYNFFFLCLDYVHSPSSCSSAVCIISLEDSLAHYFIEDKAKIKEKLLFNANKNLQEPVVTSQWSPMIKLDFSQKSILKDQSEYSSWLSRPRRRRKKNQNPQKL